MELATDPLPSEAVEKLQAAFPKLTIYLANAEDRETKAKALSDKGTNPILLLPTDNNRTVADDVADRIKAITARKKSLVGKLPEWFGAVADEVDNRTIKVMRRANEVRRRQPASTAFAVVERKQAQDFVASVDKLIAAWNNGAKEKITVLDADAADAGNKAIDKIKTKLSDLNDNLGLMESLLGSGDEEMVTQEVRLSFFPDVTRLLRILNPNVRLIDPNNGQAVTAATQKRSELRAKDAELLETRGQIADIKTRIQRIDSALIQAQAASNRTTDLLNKAIGTRNGFGDAQTQLESDLVAITDETKRKQTEAKIASVKKKIEFQDTVVTAATTDKTAADARLNSLLNEQNGLQTKRATAETELKSAETFANAIRKDLPRLAQDESDAFAAARDNAPYLFAEPFVGDPDPVRRLYLYGDPTGRTVYIRGSRDDVRAARDVIAEFDKPAPQTRLTFYAMQLNGEDKDFEKDKSAFAIVDEKLDAVTVGTKAVVGALRSAVTKKINEREKTASSGNSSSKRTGKEARHTFYSHQVRCALGDISASDAADVTRYTLPDPMRLTTLGETILVIALGGEDVRKGIKDEFQKNINAALNDTVTSNAASSITSTEEAATADDIASPQGTTTTTAAPQSDGSLRLTTTTRKIQKDNSAKVQVKTNNIVKEAAKKGSHQELIDTLLLSAKKTFEPSLSKSLEKFLGKENSGSVLPSLWRILGLSQTDVSAAPDAPPAESGSEENAERSARDRTDAMTPAQREILDALLARAKTSVAGTIYNLTRQLDEMPPELRYRSALATRIRNQYLPLIGWLVHDTTRDNSANPITSWRDEGLDALGYTDLPRGEDTEGLAQCDRLAFEVARVQYVANPLSKATGRIEAADLMVRDLIDDFDNDLKRLIRLPAIEAIRAAIREKMSGLSFGGIEETSFLATNRRVARVDPVGSGSLTVEEQANFGEAAQTLSNLLTQTKERENTRDSILGAAATTGLAAVAGANNALQTSLGLTTLLSSLLGTPGNDSQTVAAETYSINTGNVFKVTPIFGPSGQGMRFNFDFVSTTRLREPSGTTNAALPRIERHTINTEVALSNMEMRSVSSFDSNYQLGIPTQKTGGLPLLNTLPVLNQIPIIGYFSVRQGKPSLRQKSIIVAQSVIYPTIADLAGLALDAANLPITFSPETPASDRQPSERTAIKDIVLNPSGPLPYGQVATLTIRLYRPVLQDSVLSIEELGDDPVKVQGSKSRTLRRGQDTAVFSLKVRDITGPDINRIADEAAHLTSGSPARSSQTGEVLDAESVAMQQQKISNNTAELYQKGTPSGTYPEESTSATMIEKENPTEAEKKEILAKKVAVEKARRRTFDAAKKVVDTSLPNTVTPLMIVLQNDKGHTESIPFVVEGDNSKSVVLAEEIKVYLGNGADGGTPVLEFNSMPELTSQDKKKTALNVKLALGAIKVPAVSISLESSDLEFVDGYDQRLTPGNPKTVNLQRKSGSVADGRKKIAYIVAQARLNSVRIPFYYIIKAFPMTVGWQISSQDGTALVTNGTRNAPPPPVEPSSKLFLGVKVTADARATAILQKVTLQLQSGGEIISLTTPNLTIRGGDSSAPVELALPADLKEGAYFVNIVLVRPEGAAIAQPLSASLIIKKK